jgi:hypothetical protein
MELSDAITSGKIRDQVAHVAVYAMLDQRRQGIGIEAGRGFVQCRPKRRVAFRTKLTELIVTPALSGFIQSQKNRISEGVSMHRHLPLRVVVGVTGGALDRVAKDRLKERGGICRQPFRGTRGMVPATGDHRDINQKANK